MLTFREYCKIQKSIGRPYPPCMSCLTIWQYYNCQYEETDCEAFRVYYNKKKFNPATIGKRIRPWVKKDMDVQGEEVDNEYLRGQIDTLSEDEKDILVSVSASITVDYGGRQWQVGAKKARS